jgi:ABC-2 type transport system permease protein
MATATIALRGPSLLSSTLVIAKRGVLKFFRTPQLFWTMTVQGVMFLVLFRYIFGGAIGARGLSYVDFLVPGILTTAIIWQGMTAATGIAEDYSQGLFDRLRSLPIPRSAVLAGRAVSDTGMQAWGLLAMTGVSFLIGFRLHDGLANALLAYGLIVVFCFAFEWVFIVMGLYAGNAQAAQGMSLILVPFAFVSSAYVPLISLPGGLRSVAQNQPMTFMVDAVRALTGGARAEALLGHPASYYITRSLLWSAALVLVFGVIGVARYRRG